MDWKIAVILLGIVGVCAGILAYSLTIGYTTPAGPGMKAIMIQSVQFDNNTHKIEVRVMNVGDAEQKIRSLFINGVEDSAAVGLEASLGRGKVIAIESSEQMPWKPGDQFTFKIVCEDQTMTELKVSAPL